MPQSQLLPEVWSQFAAAALQALIAQQNWVDHSMQGNDALVAQLAARYADALSREWAKRFIEETK